MDFQKKEEIYLKLKLNFIKPKQNITEEKGKTMGRWIPYITDTNVVNKSIKGLLNEAMREIKKMGIKIIKTYKDDVGMIAFETENYVVVAKSYPYGWIVSAHKTTVNYAKERNKKLLMYLGDKKRFYVFSPEEIIKEGTINVRGANEFINFDLKLGNRW